MDNEKKNSIIKVYVPKEAQEDLSQWYHKSLQHPGIYRTTNTIKQHFGWPGLVVAI